MKLKRVLSIFLLSSLIIGLVGCGSYSNSSTSSDDKEGTVASEEVINLMFATEVTTLDTPNLNGNADSTIHGAVFEGLYYVDEENNVVPGVAEGMPEISEDGLVYTIKLREDAKWSNGDDVTAHDFVFAWQELSDPSKGYLYTWMAQGVIVNAAEIGDEEKDKSELGAKAIDNHTLEIELVTPAPYFTSMLTFSPFFPKNEKFVTEQGDKYGTTSENTLYNGAFVIENWDQNKLSLDLIKSETYAGNNEAKSEKIHYEIIKEASTALNLFDSGQLDVAELTGEIASQNLENPNYQAFNTGTITYIRMNHSRVGVPTVLANSDMRKALALGMDKEALAKSVIIDGSSALNGLIPEGFVNNPETGEDFRKEAGDVMEYNPEEAQKHWEKAKEALGDNVTIELLVSDDSRYVNLAEALQGMYEDAFEGLTIQITSLPQDTALARARITGGSDYDIFLIMWTPDYQDPKSTLSIWHGENSQNYVSAEYDAIMDEVNALAATDLNARWEKLIEAEKFVLEDAATIAVCTNGVSTLISDDISGMNYNAFSTISNLSLVEKK